MKFLDLIFSKNKRKWISFLNEFSTPMDRYRVSKWRFIVDNFILKYNIDYDRFMANAQWDSDRLSICQNEKDITQCSESFRTQFAKTIERKLSNKNLGINEWFYHAFPDVAKYFEDNYDKIEIHCNSLGYYYSIDDSKFNLHVFEFVIEQYLKINSKLECSLK